MSIVKRGVNSSMIKKTILLLVAVLGFLTFVLVPAITFAATTTTTAHATSPPTSITRASYAFTALITAGQSIGKPITGGLTLNVHSNGNVFGTFHASDSTVALVHGQVADSQITIAFQDTSNGQVVQGTGTANSAGEYLGTFTIAASNQQKVVASGNWTALPVANPGSVLAFALHSFITQGPDQGTTFTAAVVIDRKTLTGTFSGPNGDLANVTVVFQDDGEKIIASYANGLFIDVGYLVTDPDGYVGTLTVTGTTDKGHWSGYFFTF